MMSLTPRGPGALRGLPYSAIAPCAISRKHRIPGHLQRLLWRWVMRVMLMFAVACPSPQGTTAGAPHGAEDWCGGHGLPESKCTVCNPELTEGFKAAGDWCDEHGFPESACPVCNPVTRPGSAPPAAAHTADPADWCGGHGLPESKCTVCNPQLTEGFKAAGDWCDEHGFPESACPVCNPIAPPGSTAASPASAADWCGEHGLPESKCTLCNPELIDGFKAAGDWCAEHSLPESACPICNPVAPPEGVKAWVPGTRIRFRTAELEATVGIQTTLATHGTLQMGVQATGQITFDEDRVAEVRAPSSGVVRELRAGLGDTVSAGQALVVVESSDVGELRGRLSGAIERRRTAEANLRRRTELQDAGVSSPRELELASQEATAAASEVRAAEAALHATGASGQGSSGRYRLSSPLPGTVIRRSAVLGRAVSASDMLVLVADTSRMWAMLDVHEEDLSHVHIGQAVTMAVDGVPDQTFDGVVTWVAAEVDARTRTVSVRAALDNPDGRLRAQQFGRATIGGSTNEQVISVPREAVQRLDDGHVVFVRAGLGLYEPRAVDLGPRVGNHVAVQGPVEAGESIVTTGAFLLKTELRKDAIGAGCCEIEEPEH